MSLASDWHRIRSMIAAIRLLAEVCQSTEPELGQQIVGIVDELLILVDSVAQREITE